MSILHPSAVELHEQDLAANSRMKISVVILWTVGTLKATAEPFSASLIIDSDR